MESDGKEDSHRQYVAFKHRAARAFIDRGYSVAWSADDAAWFDVYAEEPHGVREIRAEVLLAAPPAEGSLCGGRVDQLTIYQRRLVSLRRSPVEPGKPVRVVRDEEITVYFNSARPQVDALDRSAVARRLYDDIQSVLA